MKTIEKELLFSLEGTLDYMAYAEYADNNWLRLEDFEDWKEQAEDAYSGQFDNDVDFTIQLVEDTGYLDGMPENLQNYFDYEKFARDLMYDYFSTDSGYYFLNY